MSNVESTLADRNNNPLNIRAVDGPAGDWQGKSGSKAGLVKVDKPESGVRAGAVNV